MPSCWLGVHSCKLLSPISTTVWRGRLYEREKCYTPLGYVRRQPEPHYQQKEARAFRA